MIKTKIQVLGLGCATCKRLHELTNQAVKELKLNADVEYITDLQKIISLGVTQNPALAINDHLVLAGYLPKIEKIKEILKDNI